MMRISLQAYISVTCAILVTVSAAVRLSGVQIAYFSFINEQIPLHEEKVLFSNEILLTNLMKSDDSPFEALSLPWKFNFLGENIGEVFVSPNGGLHYSPVQPCAPLNYFATNLCNFNNAYFNVIAGYVTDLDPSKSGNGSFIASSVVEGVIQVKYHNISYYNSTIHNSFRIRLFNDSHIELLYDRIVKSLPPNPAPAFWASGLRATATGSNVYFSPEQINIANMLWGTNILAIYPDPSDVKTGNQFTICPVSRAWCMTPAVVNINTENPSDAVVVLSSVLLSCSNKVQYGLLVSNATLTSSGTDNDNNSTVVLCLAHASSATLTCNISEILSLYGPGSGELVIKPVWRQQTSASSDTSTSTSTGFTALPVESLILTLENAPPESSMNNSCSNNFGNSSLCGTDLCAVCNGNYSCFDAPCAVNATKVSTTEISPSSTSILFDRPSCANDTCPIENSTDNYFLDYSSSPTSLCCLQSEMDCSGKCYGPATVAYDKDKARYCCESAARIDCAGECDGAAKLDTCGTCGGTDISGFGCFNETSEIVFSTGFDDYSMHALYDVSKNTSSDLIRTMYLNISNLSKFPIQVQFFDDPTNSADQAPVLSLPAGAYGVDINSSMEFKFEASIESLYFGSTASWATKSIVAQYYRNFLPSTVYQTKFKVYLSSKNCGTIFSRDRCLRLPACIFCGSDPHMRILRDSSEISVNNVKIENSLNNANTVHSRTSPATSIIKSMPAVTDTDTDTDTDTNTNSNAHPAGSTGSSSLRRLYVELIPEAIDRYSMVYDGVCGDGWSNQDCATISPFDFVSRAERISTTAGSQGYILLLLFVVYTVLHNV